MSANIVLIEDDDTLREGLTLILEGRGYNVNTYCSGTEFFNCPPADGPNLYLVDYRLPGPDGLQITQKIRFDDVESSIPIIILSAGGDDLPQKTKDAGANLFVRKPFEISYLTDLIEHYLAQQVIP